MREILYEIEHGTYKPRKEFFIDFLLNISIIVSYEM